MFLDGIDMSWFKTPFLSHKFHIRNEDQLQAIRDAGITHVFVREDLDESEAAEAAPAPPRVAAPNTPRAEGYAITPEEFKKYSHEKEERLQIEKGTLLRGSTVDFSLYRKVNIEIVPMAVYSGREIELTAEILECPGELLIDIKDMARYREYLKQLSSNTATGKDAQRMKNAIIKENTKIVVKELLTDPRSGNTVEMCKDAVGDLIASIHDSGGLTTSILTLNKYDYYTYTHSVEVSVLTLALAMAMGMDRERELMPLGIGSLMHDIGKSEVPPEILNKPGKLTEDEFRIMKSHVQKGLRLVRPKRDIPPESFYPLLEHHEKLSGVGYPFGLKSETIHLTGRMTAIADTYDAITTARPYQSPMSPFKALSIIQNQPDNYDMEVLKFFVKMLGNNLDDIRNGVEAQAQS